MSESLWSFNADTGKCVLYARGPVNNEVFSTSKLSFSEAHELARAFESVFQQGVERGRTELAANVRQQLPDTSTATNTENI